MIAGYNNIIQISKPLQSNCTSKIFANINNFKQILHRTSVGESITATEPFELETGYPGITSKWVLIFYPNGQYDYGFASENCRVYMKLISCDAVDKILNVIVSICFKTPAQPFVGSVKKGQFNLNDQEIKCLGPIDIKTPRFYNETDQLAIQCNFQLELTSISKELHTPDYNKNMTTKSIQMNINFKRSFADSILSSFPTEASAVDDSTFKFKKSRLFSQEERAAIKKEALYGDRSSSALFEKSGVDIVKSTFSPKERAETKNTSTKLETAEAGHQHFFEPTDLCAPLMNAIAEDEERNRREVTIKERIAYFDKMFASQH